MDSYNKIIDIFITLIGIYMFYAGISGKGNIYKTEYVKEKYVDKYEKLIKYFCLVGSPLAVAMGIVDYIRLEPYATILFFVLCAFVVIALVTVFFFIDRKKAKKSSGR